MKVGGTTRIIGKLNSVFTEFLRKYLKEDEKIIVCLQDETYKDALVATNLRVLVIKYPRILGWKECRYGSFNYKDIIDIKCESNKMPGRVEILVKEKEGLEEKLMRSSDALNIVRFTTNPSHREAEENKKNFFLAVNIVREISQQAKLN